jgi:type I restriction enzyme S subunit
MSDPTIHEWKNRRIGEICEILDSRRVPVNATERNSRIGPYPYYGANGIQGYIDDYIFDEPTVLLAEDGGYFDEYASRPIAQYVSGRYWVNNHAHVLRGKSDTDTKWLFYSLVHKNILRFINGGTRAKLNQSDLIEISVHQPPLAEQKKIADILTTVDEVIENIEAEISKLEDLKKATMNELLTKGIEHTEFKETEIGRIPKSWKLGLVSELFDLGRGRVISSNDLRQFAGRYPVYSSQSKNDGIFGCINTFDFDGEYITWTTDGAYAGTVFYRNGRFNCTNVCGTLSDKKSKSINMQFMAIYLSTVAKKYVSYVGNPKLMNNAFAEIIVVVPEKNEQDEIVAVITACADSIKRQEQVVSKMRKIKKSLMQDLLTGKVRIKVN